MHIAAIQWQSELDPLPLVYEHDVLPLAPFTILFGANDSGKSSTLRVIADELDRLSRRIKSDRECSVIVCFRDDPAAFEAMLVNLRERHGLHMPMDRWMLEVPAQQLQLPGDEMAGLTQALAQAPVFLLDVRDQAGNETASDGWLLSLVDSPVYERETPALVRTALDRLNPPVPRVHPEPEFIALMIDSHPKLRHRHIRDLGETSLPCVPKPQLLPAGIEDALDSLDDAVQRAAEAFGAWTDTRGGTGHRDLWSFRVGLGGDLERRSDDFLPPFVAARYRFDFDPSTPQHEPWATDFNVRLAAAGTLRQHDTFAEKTPVDHVASGFALWIELAIQDMIAEVDAVTATLLVASCADLAFHLDADGPGSRLDALHAEFDKNIMVRPSWLCPTEERRWRLNVLATAIRTDQTADAIDACERSTRPRLLLIDEPERHLNARVARETARWLCERSRDAGLQIVIATHSPAFLVCSGDEVRHVQVRRATNGVAYDSFTPSDQAELARVASDMGLDHGELLGLATSIVWVEGAMDAVVLDALAGEALRRRGAHIARYGGLGNIESVLNSPLTRLPGLRFVLLVDDLSPEQLDAVHGDPGNVTAQESDEMRSAARVVQQAKAMGRQLSVVSHGAPDIFLALSDDALAETARGTWPGKKAALRQADHEGIRKSKLKGFVADRYGLVVDEAHCRLAAERTRTQSIPEWVDDVLDATDG